MSYEIGPRLRRYREIKGLSQKEFARLMGVSNSRVSNWELGINRPDADIIAKICEVLTISADELLDIKLSAKNKQNAPEPVATDSEAIRRMQLLINSFEAVGYVRPGEDLTDEQLRFCMALVDFLDTYFGRNA